MCSVAAFLSIWLKIRTLNLMLWDVRIYGVEYGWDRKSSDKICRLKENGLPQNQDDIAEMIGISVDTFQNYKNLQKWFQSWVNDPAKDRKAMAIYVELKGYKHGEMGNGRKKTCQNGTSTLDEIAKELRNWNDCMEFIMVDTDQTNICRVRIIRILQKHKIISLHKWECL